MIDVPLQTLQIKFALYLRHALTRITNISTHKCICLPERELRHY